MRRLSPILAAIATALLVGGVAWAAGSPTSTPVEMQTEDVVNIAAGDAALVSVAVADGGLEIVDVATNPGWTAEVERPAGIEVEATFRNGADRIDFNAQLEDGQIRVRVRERATGSESVTFVPVGGETTISLPDNTTPTPADDSTPTTEGSTATTMVDDDTTSTTIHDDDDTTTTTIHDDDDDTTTTTIHDDEDDDDDDTTSTTIHDDASAVADGTYVYPVGAGGSVTVTVADGKLSLAAVNAPSGWTYQVERQEAYRIEIAFVNGDDEIDVEIRTDHGSLEVDIDD